MDRLSCARRTFGSIRSITRSQQSKFINTHVNYVPVLSRKGSNKLEGVQGLKCMPHFFLFADIQISLLF